VFRLARQERFVKAVLVEDPTKVVQKRRLDAGMFRYGEKYHVAINKRRETAKLKLNFGGLGPVR
jgi:hypothetical protein